MKLSIQHFDIRSTQVIDALIQERLVALQDRLQIDEASVRLEHRNESSPAFHVAVHLVTPGPDVLAEAQDHTIRAAVDKVVAQLEQKIQSRSLKRDQRPARDGRAPYGF